MHFQIALASEHATAFGWLEFCSVSLEGSWQKRIEWNKEERITVKPKSTDNYIDDYIGRPNEGSDKMNALGSRNEY